MLKRTLVACSLSFLVLGLVATADDAPKGAETDKLDLEGLQCFFCKMQVKEDVAVDYKGAKVFLGCSGCVNAFKTNTAKIAAKANYQLVATKQAKQKACPMSGAPTKSEHSLKVGKTSVGFCCPSCKGAAEALQGDEQIEKLFAEKSFKNAFEIVKK